MPYGGRGLVHDPPPHREPGHLHFQRLRTPGDAERVLRSGDPEPMPGWGPETAHRSAPSAVGN
eukprot:2553695-Pyramimonas_sp.AAC.1